MAYTPANGTLLQLDIASVYTTVVQRTEIDPPERTRAKIETTDLDSTDETSIGASIRRNGEVKLKGWHDAAATTHAALLTAYTDGLARNWKIIFADAGNDTDAFSGWVMSYKKGTAQIDGLVEINITICVTGAIANTP